MDKILSKVILYFFIFFVLSLTFYSSFFYEGSLIILFLFSLAFNFFLLISYLYLDSYFYKFLSIFMWLGFWLKFNVRLSFFENKYFEPTGLFNFNADSWDEVLIVSIVCVVSFTLSGLTSRFLQKKQAVDRKMYSVENVYYMKYRLKLWVCFLFFVGLISFFNNEMSIYQRGIVASTQIPFFISSFFKWFLLFGACSISSILIFHEFLSGGKRSKFLSLCFGMLETAISNTSMLSRGMVLNASSLMLGFYDTLKIKYQNVQLREIVLVITVFLSLFIVSGHMVWKLRLSKYTLADTEGMSLHRQFNQFSSNIKILLLDRWVGLEGVMAVQGSKIKGWDTFYQSIDDLPNSEVLPFYDRYFIDSPYKESVRNKNNFMTIPGIAGFLYYSGSIFLVFIISYIMGLLGFLFEWFAVKYSGNNSIFAALIGQVIAYRYTHFGAYPKQSNLLFGSIVLTIVLIFIVRKLIQIRLQQRAIL